MTTSAAAQTRESRLEETASPADDRRARPPKSLLAMAFATIYVLWGGTFLAIRVAVAEMPPLVLMLVRCACGSAILFTWLAARRRLERTTAAQWAAAAVAGTLMFLGCHGLLAWAERHVASGTAALYLATTSLWLVVLSAVREHQMPKGSVLLGLALGIPGVAVLAGSAALSSGRPVDRLVLVVSAFSWAAGSMVGRHGPRPNSIPQQTAMQLFFGAVALLATSAATGDLAASEPERITPLGAAALAFLVFSSVVCMAAYTWLLRVTNPAAVGTYAFVNPVVAILLAVLVGDEEFTWNTAIAAALVVGAVVVTLRAGKR
jgi:drug/metabolite transporter (DMT)-like permease